MKNILIIGLGSIGCHHFTGVLKSKISVNIYLVDINPNAFLKVKQIYENINVPQSKYYFADNFDAIPKDIEIAIIATNSKERFQILAKIIGAFNIKHLILEKFVFPSPHEFTSAFNLISQSPSNVYINCPLRIWQSFNAIKKNVVNSSVLDISVSGVGWGLGSNGIHYVDLFSFLAETTDLNFKDHFLLSKISKNKREGYSEINGTISTYNKTHSKTLTLTSFEGERSALFIKINSDDFYYEISFGSTIKVIEREKNNKSHDVVISEEIEYQSNLTASLVKELIQENTCNLPLFLETYMIHLNTLSCILSFLKKVGIEESNFYIT